MTDCWMVDGIKIDVSDIPQIIESFDPLERVRLHAAIEKAERKRRREIVYSAACNGPARTEFVDGFAISMLQGPRTTYILDVSTPHLPDGYDGPEVLVSFDPRTGARSLHAVPHTAPKSKRITVIEQINTAIADYVMLCGELLVLIQVDQLEYDIILCDGRIVNPDIGLETEAAVFVDSLYAAALAAVAGKVIAMVGIDVMSSVLDRDRIDHRNTGGTRLGRSRARYNDRNRPRAGRDGHDNHGPHIGGRGSNMLVGGDDDLLGAIDGIKVINANVAVVRTDLVEHIDAITADDKARAGLWSDGWWLHGDGMDTGLTLGVPITVAVKQEVSTNHFGI